MEGKENKEKVNDDTVSSSSGLDCPCCCKGKLELSKVSFKKEFPEIICNYCGNLWVDYRDVAEMD